MPMRYSQDRGPNWMTIPDSTTPIARTTTDEGNSTAEVVHSRQYVWDAGGGTWVKGTAAAGGGGGDGAILDGVSASIKATVFDFTNSNPVAVVLRDTAGDYVSVGGGTQYTEDVATPADPTGTAIAARRRDTLAAEVTTDGDWVTTNATNKGELYVKHVDSVPVSFGSGTFPVSGPLTDAQLRAAAVPVSGTFWQATQPVSGTFFQATQPVSIAATVTVDTELPPAAAIAADNQAAPTAPSVYNFPLVWDAGGGNWDRAAQGLTDTQLRASAVPVSGAFFPATQPVSIAAAVPVTDNAGSLTVDGTFWQATQPVSGPLTDAQLRATPVPVSGTVTANAATSHGKTITYVSVNQGAAGTTVIAAASPGNKHKIVGAVLTISATGTFKFTGTGDLTGPLDLTATGGFVLPTSIMPYFVGSTNVDLSLVSVAGAVRGVIAILTEA